MSFTTAVWGLFGRFDDLSKCGETPFSEQTIGIRAAVYAAGVIANMCLSASIYALSYAAFGYGNVLPCRQCQPSVFMVSQLYGLSFWLALFNLVPIPPLDGGMLLIVCLETLTRKRLSRRAVTVISQAGLVSMVLLSVSTVGYLIAAGFGIT